MSYCHVNHVAAKISDDDQELQLLVSKNYVILQCCHQDLLVNHKQTSRMKSK